MADSQVDPKGLADMLDRLVVASANLDTDEEEGRDSGATVKLQRQGVLRSLRSMLKSCSVEEIEDLFEGYNPVGNDHFGDGYGQAVVDEVHGDELARLEPDNEIGLSLLLGSGKAFRTGRAYRHAAATYRKAMARASELALDERAADAYRARMLCAEEGLRRRNPPKSLIYAVWRLSSNYGQSWLRWGLCVLAAILVFGIVYLPTPQSLPWDGGLLIDEPYAPADSWFNAFFASAIALGLPGLGGVSPGNDLTKLLLVLNGLTGFFLVGVLATLLTQRLLNRR